MKENIPEFLYEILIKEYGENVTKKIIEGYSKKRPTTFRVNTVKTDINTVKDELQNLKINFREINWNKNAFILDDETEIRQTSLYENGEIYIQNLSSMIPPIVLAPKAGESILDMAAAPGGKTTQMANLSDNKAMITACEKNKIRAERLKYNLEKQGAGRVNVMQQDARKLSDFFSFDKILLDAPCSGSGTINVFDNNVEKYYTKELLNRSIKTQKELLRKAEKIVKSDGEIIYSTCSILKEENENIVKEILDKTNLEIIPIDEKDFEGIPLLPVTIPGTICVCPNELYEGFFVAKLRKIFKKNIFKIKIK